MQLINNQPYVIPLIEGMDQELKKFEVIFHWWRAKLKYEIRR
jgi:hypothetical protein